MADLRDFFGSRCPVCSKDILQQAPSVARMPPGQYAFCPSCESTLTLADLTHLTTRKRGFLSRLFKSPSGA